MALMAMASPTAVARDSLPRPLRRAAATRVAFGSRQQRPGLGRLRPGDICWPGLLAAASLCWQQKLRRQEGRKRKTALRAEMVELFTKFGPEDNPFELQPTEILGTGGQGTVYRCRRGQGEEFAVKAVPIWRLQADPESSQKLAVFEKEMGIIQRVQGHPSIASYVGCWDVPHPLGKDAVPAMYKMMVVELVEGGELASIIAEKGALDEPTARNVLHQVLLGIRFMHGRKVLHRDLKCENILVCSKELTANSCVKLIDFGVARIIEGSYAKTCVGSRDILAPEVACAKLMVSPGGPDAGYTDPLTFAPPQEKSPGFGLTTARPDGTGALVNGIEPGGQGEANGVQDGWAIARINGTGVTEMPFVPDPEDPQKPSIVGLLQSLSDTFTLEFVELPERRFTEAVDMWSLGCVLYTMLAGVKPFATEQDIVSGSYSRQLLDHTSEEAKDLIQRLLTVDPQQRATSEEVESHPWMRTD